MILVSDMFYQKSQAHQIISFLKKNRSNGATVLIADGERTFAPQSDINIIWEEKIPVNRDLEGVDERLVRLLYLF